MRSRDGVEESERRQRAAQHFDFVRTCAVNGLNELTIHDRARVGRVIAWLEEAIAGLRNRGAWRQCIDAALLSHAALTVFYGGDAECLRLFARAILGSGTHWTFPLQGRIVPVEKLPSLSRALVDCLLEDTKGWRDADNPLKFVADAAYNLARKEAREEAAQAFRNYATGTRQAALPLEEVGDVADPAPDGDRSGRMIEALLRGAPPDVEAYGELILQGYTHEEARRKLSWYKKRAHKAEVAYRKHLKQARSGPKAGALRQEIESLSNASHTTCRVTFKDAERRHGYYEHRADYPKWKKP